jgi:hypothetical protein
MIGLGVIIGALLMRVGVDWFLDNFERAVRKVHDGHLLEARKNPLLAAERYLKRIGTDVKSINTSDLWRNLPSAGDAIIIYRYSPPAGELRRKALRQWIEDGGQLFVEADESLFVRDDLKSVLQGSQIARGGLLAELGISLHYHDSDYYTKNLSNDKQIEIEFLDYKEKLAVDFSGYSYLQIDKNIANPNEAVSCGKGYCLLQYKLGKGVVTVTSDISFVGNYRLGEHDHALVLAMLRPNMPSKVWLVFDVDVPPLTELIWKHGPHALFALLITVLLWLWRIGARLGPLLPPLQQPRRSIDEHLMANAGFLWRLDSGKQLFIDNQRNLKQAWFSKHFLLRSMDREESCVWIAARSGISPEEVWRALYDTYSSEQEFIELTSYFQRLKMAL